MRIREATLADAPAIAAGMKAILGEADWLATPRSTPTSALEERFARTLGHHGTEDVLLVADDEGAIVGCTGIQPTQIADAWSLGTWVAASHRRRGLGRRMIEAALVVAVERGVRKLALEAFSDNGPAVALYSSTGFEVEGIRRDHYLREDGTLRSAIVMALFPAGGPRT